MSQKVFLHRKKSEPFCFCNEQIKEKNPFAECQDHLKNWERWMIKRTEIHNKLTKSVRRPAGELLMNINEEYRNVIEDKTAFEYSGINTYFDKYRGNPAFWKLPPGLVSKPNVKLDTIYFSVETKEQRNEIPHMQFVETPRAILQEKNILPRTRNLYLLWKNNAYRTAQFKKLSSKIDLIEPHFRPNMDNLIIRGEKIVLKEETAAAVTTKNEVSLLQEKFFNLGVDVCRLFEDKAVFQVHCIADVGLAVNNMNVTGFDINTNIPMKIRVLFECHTNEKSAVLKHLSLENTGLTTLRLYWKPFKKSRLFRDISKGQEDDHAFHFDKRETIITPRKSVEFPIWFKSNRLGSHNEDWEITTVPKIWSDDFQLIISLQGFVSIKDFDETVEEIKTMLDNRIRNTLIKDLLNDIFANLKFSDSNILTSSYTEEQLFEGANRGTYLPEKSSQYLYSVHVVAELKEFYKTVRGPLSANEWNYSISDLKVLTRIKDVMEYIEHQTLQSIRARERRLELIESINNPTVSEIKPDLKSRKSEAPRKSQSGKPDAEVPEEDQLKVNESYYSKLENLLHKLERPSMLKNIYRHKYFFAYIIMKTYFIKMCDVLQNTRPNENEDDDNYPFLNYDRFTSVDDIPERLIFERFDETSIERTKRIPPDGKQEFPMFPRPDNLNKIPPDDIKTLYRVYFNAPDPEAKGKKEGKGTEKPGNKGKVTVDKKGKDVKKEAKPRVITVKEGFDPFSEVYVPKVVEKFSMSEPMTLTLQASTDYTKYRDSYLIVYTYLREAIDAIVDSLETLKESTITSDVLAEMVQYKIPEDDNIYEDKVSMEDATRTTEDNAYFRYLLNNHLHNNTNTEKYIIQGLTKESVLEIEDSVQSQVEDKSESLLNVFRSHEVIKSESTVSFGLISAGIQTSLNSQSDFPPVSKIFENETAKKHSSTSSDSKSSDSMLSKDVLYYISDEDTVEGSQGG